MKRPALIAVGIAAVAIATTQSLADNTDNKSVSVGGNVVASLDIAVDANLVMPNVVRPAPTEVVNSTVTMTCNTSGDTSNSIAYSGNGSPFAHGNTSSTAGVVTGSVNAGAFPSAATGTCAKLTVSGQSNYSFLTSISNAGLLGGTPPGISVGNVSCINQSGATIINGVPLQLVGGNHVIRCGATTIVAPSSVAPAYSTSFSYTVTYD